MSKLLWLILIVVVIARLKEVLERSADVYLNEEVLRCLISTRISRDLEMFVHIVRCGITRRVTGMFKLVINWRIYLEQQQRDVCSKGLPVGG